MTTESVTSTLPLVPKPLTVERTTGSAPWVADATTAIVADGDAVGPATLLAEDLRRATGWDVPVAASAPSGAATVSITIDPTGTYPTAGPAGTAEAYHLVTSPTGVTIRAKTAHGAFNATQTLRQLLPAWVASPAPLGGPLTAPAVSISDAPRFSYRGVMIDVARSFQTVDEMKHHIDQLALGRASTLHLHLADDQGWRIEITNEGKAAGDPIDYTQLTARSSITAMNQRSYQGEFGRTGFYTQEQYSEIVEYARDRFIEVVPEVDFPSHTNAALHAIPQLNTARSLPARDPKTGVVPWNGTGDVGYSAVDEQHELTYVFAEHVFSQLADLTGGPYVHIGGDESHAMGHTRYVDFITKVVPRVRAATGQGTIGWSEYAEAGLSQGPGFWNGSVVQYWVGSGDWVRDFIAKGGKAIVSSAGGSYVDQKYDASTPIGLSWACSGSCDIDKYYGWDPTTTVEGGIAESGVLGVEAPLWSETVRGPDQAQYLMLPRALAVLEIGWTTAANKNLADFSARLGALGGHLTVAGANYHETPKASWAASSTGRDLHARTGTTAAWPVGAVVAPGTKISADGKSLVADTVTTDGDPASASAVTGPVTASLVCGGTTHPVTFTTERARGIIHAAGVYTARASTAFSAGGDCTFQTAGGLVSTHRVALTTSADAPLPQGPFAPTDPASISVGQGAATVKAGEWTHVSLRGFDAARYASVSLDSRVIGTVRPGATGMFSGHVPLPSDLYAGQATIAVTQGTRTASTTVTVESGLQPLPDLIDQSNFSVADVDSQETVGENGAAANAIDGNPSTIWHTQWQGATPPFPHHITLDLGGRYDVSGLGYLRRQNADNGVFKDYEIYVSADGKTWGAAVAKGTFTSSKLQQNITFTPKLGRFVKLVGLSSLAGNAFGGAAEINVGGTVAPGAVPRIEATTLTPCVGPNAGVRVDVTNTATAPSDLTITGPGGEKSFAGVAPGATVTHTFDTGTRVSTAGTVTVVSRTNADGIPLQETFTVAHGSTDCRDTATVTATLAKDVIRVGQAGIVNVTVSGSEDLPTGTVVATEGARTLATGQLGARSPLKLTLPSNLTPGRHIIDVTYAGDSDHKAASGRVVLTVR